MMPALDKNLDQLHAATGAVRDEFTGAEREGIQRDVVKRFFHLLLMECAERMTVADFRKSIEVAREQVRKPIL